MKKACFLLLALILLCSLSFTLAENDRLDKATPIHVNADVNEFLSSAKDVDFFQFELTQPGAVSLSFSHEYENSDLRWRSELMDADSHVYMEHGFEGRAFSTVDTCVVGLPAGTFFVKISPYYSGYYFSGVYTLRVNYEASDAWETEFNDNIAYSSDAISVNTDISGSLSRQKDVDYYRFDLRQPGPVSISFSHEYVDAELRWKVELMDQGGELLTEEGFRGDAMSRITTCSVGLPKGTYFIKISPYYSGYFSPATYTFRVNYEESAVWETELNDNIASGSDPIPLNTSISGAINLKTDRDHFRFETEADGVVRIAFSHAYQDSELRWKLELLDAEGHTFLTKGYRGDSMAEIVSCPLGLAAGQYFIRLTPYYSGYYCSGTYTLRVDYEAEAGWETEYNDSPVAADKGTLNQWLRGTMAQSVDRDYFMYQLDQAKEYSLHFMHDANSRTDNPWRVDILDQNQKSLSSWTYKGTEVTDNVSSITLQPGTYYIMVSCNYSNAAPEEPYSLMLE